MMRDLAVLAQTIQQIRNTGLGKAYRIELPMQRYAWQSGKTTLNTQAVVDLIADGWLSAPDGSGTIEILAMPPFAA
jgi:hypothetical protein